MRTRKVVRWCSRSATVLRSSTVVLSVPLLTLRWVEEPPPTTEPSVPVQTVDAWTASAHSEKLALGLLAVFALGCLSGLLLGKR